MKQKQTVQDTTEEFLTWLQVERRFAQSSIVSYRSRLKCFVAEGKQNRWDRNDAQRNFRNYRRRLGLSSSFTAHTIRHNFAMLLLKKGVSLGHI